MLAVFVGEIVVICLMGSLFGLAELVRPAVARAGWTRRLPQTFAIFLVVMIFGFTAHHLIQSGLTFGATLLHLSGIPIALMAVPLVVKLVVMRFGTDLGMYWVHRSMHTRALWRFHRWHHSTLELNWLSGWRSSFFHLVLNGVPSTLMAWAFHVPRPWIIVLGLSYVFEQLFNHTNVDVNLGPLEWLLVTPRTHRLHHSVEPAHRDSNFGFFLTIWDRMFGTYQSPREVAAGYALGLDPKDDARHPI